VKGAPFVWAQILKEHGSGDRSQYQRRQYLAIGYDVCEAMFRLSKPVVAALTVMH